MFRHPTPTTTPKLQLDLLDNFLVKVWGGGGGVVWHQTLPTTTTPKLQLDFLDLENFLVKVWGGGGGGGGGVLVPDPPPPLPPLNFNLTFWTYLNQKCRKSHEMDKSTKKNFSLFGQSGLRNFFVKVWGGGGGCQKSHLNQKCRKFHEMDKATKKNFFHCLANLDLEIFLSKFEVVVGGGGGKKSHLNQKCRKFHEMDKSTKKIFSLFGQPGLRSSGDQNEGWQPLPTTNLNP